MKHLFTLLACMAIGLATMAQSNSLYNGVYVPASNNGPDAEYQLILREYKSNADNTSSIRYRKEIKILRNRALTAYADKGESFIVWNPATQKVTINECYTIQADGKRVEMNPQGYVEQLPSNCVDCAHLNGIREMAIVHCGMEIGCTIVLDYTITNLKSDIIQDYFVIPQDCPVKKYEIIADFNNKESEYFHTVSNPSFDFKCQEINDDSHNFHLIFTDIDQTYQASYLPQARELYPIVCISNYPKKETTKWEYEPIAEAEDLIATCHNDNPLTFALQLRDYVVDFVHYNAISPIEIALETSKASKTWKNNCGTAIEKAFLLANLFRQAGLGEATIIEGSAEGFCQMSYVIPEMIKVRLTLNGTNYDFSPISKNNVTPSKDNSENKNPTVQLDYKDLISPMAGRYNKITLPNDKSFRMNAGLLTANRTAPLAVGKQDECYTYKITLPEGMHMVGKPVSIEKKNKDLGQMRINISQEGNIVTVERYLKIEQDIISNKKHYKTFRNWMIDWDTYRSFIIK